MLSSDPGKIVVVWRAQAPFARGQRRPEVGTHHAAARRSCEPPPTSPRCTYVHREGTFRCEPPAHSSLQILRRRGSFESCFSLIVYPNSLEAFHETRIGIRLPIYFLRPEWRRCSRLPRFCTPCGKVTGSLPDFLRDGSKYTPEAAEKAMKAIVVPPGSATVQRSILFAVKNAAVEK